MNHPSGTVIIPFDGDDAENPFFHYKNVMALKVEGDGSVFGLVKMDKDTVIWVAMEDFLPAGSKLSYSEEENEDADILSLDLKKPN